MADAGISFYLVRGGSICLTFHLVICPDMLSEHSGGIPWETAVLIRIPPAGPPGVSASLVVSDFFLLYRFPIAGV